MGIWRTDKIHSAKYSHNSDTSLTHKKQQTQMALDSKLSCQRL